jgi:hypothetical protein
VKKRAKEQTKRHYAPRKTQQTTPDGETLDGGSDTRGDGGYFVLAEHVWHSIQTDLHHTCGAHSFCQRDANGCQTRKNAEQDRKFFLSGGSIWSNWVDLAQARSGYESESEGSARVGQHAPSATRIERPAPILDPNKPLVLGIREEPIIPASPSRVDRQRAAACMKEEQRRARQLTSQFQKGHVGHYKNTIETYARERGLLTTEQAMAIVGFTRNGWYKNVVKKRIPIADSCGPAKLFRRADIDAFMQTKRYQRSVSIRNGLLAKQRVTAQTVVEAGFSLDARGVDEFMRLLRTCEKEKLRDTSLRYAAVAL